MASEIIDELELRDGERILVRPIRPADGDLLAQLHARLSSDSVYRRYFGAKPALRPAEVRRFTVIAEQWWFALVGVRASGQLAAVARYKGQAGQATRRSPSSSMTRCTAWAWAACCSNGWWTWRGWPAGRR